MYFSQDGSILKKVEPGEIKRNGSFDIPAKVTTIGDGKGTKVFEGCNLQNLTIPESVTTIASWAFDGCHLPKLTIPKSVTTIESWAFRESKLKRIIFEEGPHYIKDFAFRDCKELKVVTLHKGVKEIGKGAFVNCTNLDEVTISEGPTVIGEGAFEDCKSLITVNLPKGLKTIGKSAFQECDSLGTVTIPEGTVSIRGNAFLACVSLETVNLPEGMIDIASTAFDRCSSLQSIVINSKDDNEIERIKKLLPQDLAKKVIKKELADFINFQLSKIEQAPEMHLPKFLRDDPVSSIEKTTDRHQPESVTDDSDAPYMRIILSSEIKSYINDGPKFYQEARTTMLSEPFPRNEKEMETYKSRLKDIADDTIKKGKESLQNFVEQTNKVKTLGPIIKRNFEDQLAAIEKKAKKLEINGYTDAATAANTLCEQIRTRYKQITPENSTQFKQDCLGDIDKLRGELEKHRGWKRTLSYLALSVTIVGSIVVLADVIHKHKTGQHYFSFFKTKTAKKIKGLEETLDEIPQSPKKE